MAEGTDRSDDGMEEGEHNRTKRGTELPADVVDEAERLTRRARRVVDPNEAAAYRDRRASILSDHGFRARVREEDRDTLVLYPDEWVRDGTAQLDRIDDVSRATERPLEGPGEADEWEVVESHNRELAETVAAEHGPIHGENAHSLADFASNHYAKQIGKLSAAELAEFREEYFPRNAWPSEDQKTVVSESVRLTFAAAGQPVPTDRS